MATFFLVDSQHDTLIKVNPLNTLQTTGTFGTVGSLASALTVPDTLAVLNGDLWTYNTQVGSNALWRINPFDPDDVSGDYGEVGSIPSHSGAVNGMDVYNGDLYILTGGGASFLRVDPSNPGRTTGGYGVLNSSSLNFSAFNVQGMAHLNDYFYFVTSGVSGGMSVSHLWRMPVNSLTPESLGRLPTGLLFPRGMTAADGVLYIATLTTEEAGSSSLVEGLWRINPLNRLQVTGGFGHLGEWSSSVTRIPSGLASFVEIEVTLDDVTETIIDGGAVISLSGTWDTDHAEAVTISTEVDGGTVGTITQDSTAETWSFDWIAPAGVSEDRTYTITILATDTTGRIGCAFITFTVRGVPFYPTHDPDRDFNISYAITGEDSLYGVWADLSDDLLFVIDADGADSSVPFADRDVSVKAFDFTTRTRVRGNDIDLSGQSPANNQPRGITGNDTYVWVSDYDSSGPAAYRRSDGAYVSGQTISGSGSNEGLGLTSDGTYLWEMIENRSDIYAYLISTRARSSSEDVDVDDMGVGGFGGIYTDGTTMWVMDTQNDRVRAFDIDSGDINPFQEFELSPDNARPWGIWGDTTHFYVTDTEKQKVFAYAWNVFTVSLPDVDDIDLETGQAVDFILPEATVRGFNNEVDSYSVSGLPSGLSFDADERRVTGTAASSPTAQTFTYTVEDTEGNTEDKTVRLVIWRARPTLYPWTFKQTPTAQQFNDHISDFIDYYAGRDGVFRPYQSYRLPDITPNSVVVLNGDGDVVGIAPGTAGQVLYGQGTGATPSWEDYSGDDFDVESWLIDRFDDGDSDWSSNPTRTLTRDHSLGRIPKKFGWCFEYVGVSQDADTSFSPGERVYFPFGVESSGQEDWAFIPNLLWASSTVAAYRVARWPDQTETNDNLAGFVFRDRLSGARVLARNIQTWGLRLFLWG